MEAYNKRHEHSKAVKTNRTLEPSEKRGTHIDQGQGQPNFLALCALAL